MKATLEESRRKKQVQGLLELSGRGVNGQASEGDVGVKGMETVPVNVQVHRHEVPGAFLEASAPPQKINKKTSAGNRRKVAVSSPLPGTRWEPTWSRSS